MLCEFVFFYASVYFLVRSVRDCFRYGAPTDMDEDGDGDGNGYSHKDELYRQLFTILKLCPVAFYDAESPLDAKETECCICMEPYKHRAPIRRTPCKHFFCNTCFIEWIERTENPTYPCPLCNRSLLEPYLPLVSASDVSSSSVR